MTDNDRREYNQAKRTAVNFFNNNDSLPAAYLKKVYLNADGLRHLIYKNEKHKRGWRNQLARFKLLKYLPDVLAGMKYYQEYQEEEEFVKIRMNKKVKMEKKVVRYWGFVAVIKNQFRVKYIFRKIGNGRVYLYSVIPAWKMRGYRRLLFREDLRKH